LHCVRKNSSLSLAQGSRHLANYLSFLPTLGKAEKPRIKLLIFITDAKIVPSPNYHARLAINKRFAAGKTTPSMP
jgi:hypothetical protein